MIYTLVISFIILFQATVFGEVISKPLYVIHTPDSILNHKELYKPLNVGNRLRYATCTGVAWFHDNYLAVLNLYGRNIISYTFDQANNEFHVIQKLKLKGNGSYLLYPENISISPDGSLLALCSDRPNSGVALFKINKKNHLIEPNHFLYLKADFLVHNVKFTHDGRYLALVEWDTNKYISIYKIFLHESVTLKKVFSQASDSLVLKPKGIQFSKDDKFCFVCYGQGLNDKEPLLKAKIEVYRFDSESLIGPIYTKHVTGVCFEDIALLDDNHIALTNQVGDSVFIYSFDNTTGLIDEISDQLLTLEAQLSFPHGISVTKDGKFIAVSNYGDDKVTIYQYK